MANRRTALSNSWSPTNRASISPVAKGQGRAQKWGSKRVGMVCYSDGMRRSLLPRLGGNLFAVDRTRTGLSGSTRFPTTTASRSYLSVALRWMEKRYYWRHSDWQAGCTTRERSPRSGESGTLRLDDKRGTIIRRQSYWISGVLTACLCWRIFERRRS